MDIETSNLADTLIIANPNSRWQTILKKGAWSWSF